MILQLHAYLPLIAFVLVGLWPSFCRDGGCHGGNEGEGSDETHVDESC